MIQINSNICTEVNVDFDMTGNETVPSLRLSFLMGDFFVGFNGNDKRIDIPALNNISFPESLIRAKIEVVLGNYNIKIWEEEIEIINSTENITENSINKIKIKVHLKRTQSTEPKLSVKEIEPIQE